MNEHELQDLLARGNPLDRPIDAASITNPGHDRSLLVAAGTEETFHVYMTGGRLHVLHRDREMVRRYQGGDSLPLQAVMPPPGFRVFSDSTEWGFAKKLHDLGIDLVFDPINVDAGANRHRFYHPYHLPVAASLEGTGVDP